MTPARRSRARTRRASGACCSPASGRSSWARDDALAAAHASLVVSYGLHPQLVATLDDAACDRVVRALDERLARRDARVVAVGEIGLDGVGERRASLERQERLFRAQLALARAHGLPVALHVLEGAPARARHFARRAAAGRRRPALVLGLGRAGAASMSRSACYVSFSGSITWHGGDNKAARAAAAGAARAAGRRDRRARSDARARIARTQRARLPGCNRSGDRAPLGRRIRRRRARHRRQRAATVQAGVARVGTARKAIARQAAARRAVARQATARQETAYRLHRRFDRIGRLVGDAGMEQLYGAHVMVVGLGGVGSFAVEALARSRRRHALARRLRSRLRHQHQPPAAGGWRRRWPSPRRRCSPSACTLINPQATALAVPLFYSAKTCDAAPRRARPDFVVDAIDNVTAKCHLLATCKAARHPRRVVDGRVGPHGSDAAARRRSRRDRGRSAGRRRAPRAAAEVRLSAQGAVRHPGGLLDWSRRRRRTSCTTTAATASAASAPAASNEFHSCEERRVIYGTAGFVTGAFGLACACVVVRALADAQ